METKSYRKNLSLVAQESTLYEGTIRENVALSVEDEEATDEAIERVCKSAQIHDFIISLSEGKLLCELIEANLCLTRHSHRI